jgi:hypothetical protein
LGFGMPIFGGNRYVGSHSPHILFECANPC